jgi:hypothetical protein
MKKEHYPILLLSLLNVVIHLFLINRLECHRDELFYTVLGDHLSWGYATTQPLIGFLSFLTIRIFGYSVLAIKLIPALMSGIMVWLIADITTILGGKAYARMLASVGFIITPISLRSFMLYQPVFLDLFFWTLTFLLLLKYLSKNNPRYLILLGITAGLGMMNKHLIALLLMLILVTISFTRYRKIYRRKEFYVGLLICLIIMLPNMIWQFLNHFPLISHMNALRNQHLVHVNRVDFLTEQLLMPFAGTLMTIPGLLNILFNKRMKAYRFIGMICLLVVLSLFLMRGKHYYTQAIYPLLIAAGAVVWENWLKKRWSRYALITLLLLITIPVLPIAVPVFKADRLAVYYAAMEEKTGITAGRRFEDGTIHSLPQDFADMIGWEELTQIVDNAFLMVPDESRCLIYGENYGQASAVCVLGKRYGLPEAVSFHDSFLYWAPDTFASEITSFIYIHDELGADVHELFAEIRLIGKISDINAREYGTAVYLCQKPVRSFNRFWKERVEEERGR